MVLVDVCFRVCVFPEDANMKPTVWVRSDMIKY